MNEFKPTKTNFLHPVEPHLPKCREVIEYHAKKIELLAQKMESLNRIGAWLCANKYKTEHLKAPFPLHKEKSIEFMTDQMNRALQVLDLGPLDSEDSKKQNTLQVLRFFHDNRSQFFSLFAQDNLKEKYSAKQIIASQTKSQVVQLLPEDIHETVRKTVDFLENLLDEKKLKLQYLKKVSDVQRRLGKSYKKELEHLENFFKMKSDREPPNFKAATAIGFQLIQFCGFRENLIKFLLEFKIFPKETKQLQDSQFIKIDIENATVYEAKQHLPLLTELLGRKILHSDDRDHDIESPIFSDSRKSEDIFCTLVASKELIFFLKDQYLNWNQNENHLNSQVGGNKTQLSLLNSVSQLFRGAVTLRPLFLLLLQNDKAPKNLGQFCDEISENLEMLGSHLIDLNKFLSEIKTLFEMATYLSVERIIPSIEMFMKHGMFESKLEVNSMQDKPRSSYTAQQFTSDLYAWDCKGDDKTLMDSTKFSDLLKGSKVFLDKKELKEEERKLVSDFTEIHEIVLEIHQFRVELESHGYWNIRNLDSFFPNKPMPLTLEYFREKHKQISSLLIKWKSEIKSARRKAPRLRFLNAPVLGKFLIMVESCISNKVSGAGLAETLAPFLWYCFPDDFSGKKVTDVFNAQLLDRVFKEIQSEHEMARLQKLITLLSESGEIRNYIENTNYSSVSEPGVMVLDTSTPSSLFVNSVGISCRAPHPACVYHCSISSSIQDISRFLSLIGIEEFKTMHFILLNVNALELKPRQKVISKCMELASKSNLHFSLIFTQQFKVFMDLKSIQHKHEIEKILDSQYLHSHKALQKYGLNLSAVVGQPGSGKSYYIKKKLKEMSLNTEVIAVNEDFSVLHFIERVRNLTRNSKGPFGFNLDVSPFAPLQLVNQIFYQMIHGGVILDPVTGETFVLPNTVYHVFFEIGKDFV